MHWLSFLLYGNKIWMEKDKKTIKIHRDENFQNSRVRPFCPQKE